AHSKFTGEIGVCMATSGPGAVHLINGLYDAKLDHQPVLAIVGQQKRTTVGAHYQQEIDLQVLFKDVGGFVSTVMEPASARHVIEVADRLGAGVAKALLGKDSLPDTLPFVTGSIGLLGTEPSEKMMNKCDTLLMIGTSFPYSEWLPKPGQAKCVEIDIDGSLIGVRYPNDVSLVGDSRDTLRALIPMLETKRDRSWQEWIVEERKIWNEILDKRAHQAADPVNPELVFWELNQRLPDDVIITSDSGSATNWYARHCMLREGMRGSLSGTLATMCPGIPYAIS